MRLCLLETQNIKHLFQPCRKFLSLPLIYATADVNVASAPRPLGTGPYLYFILRKALSLFHLFVRALIINLLGKPVVLISSVYCIRQIAAAYLKFLELLAGMRGYNSFIPSRKKIVAIGSVVPPAFFLTRFLPFPQLEGSWTGGTGTWPTTTTIATWYGEPPDDTESSSKLTIVDDWPFSF